MKHQRNIFPINSTCKPTDVLVPSSSRAGRAHDSRVCVRAALRPPAARDSQPLSHAGPLLASALRPLNPSVGLTFALSGALFLKGLVRQWRCLPCGCMTGGGRISCVFGRRDSRSSELFGLAPGQRSCPPPSPTTIQQIARIMAGCLWRGE